ncbi:hypothetical protein [Myroides odoratus]|uniref:hypothetical protein n=1 Tax=Myroides odoratus TaxID=256 RepID=UPI0039AEC7D6
MKNIIKYLTFISILLLSISMMYGQVNKSTGTRITDSTADKELKTNAILDLESTSKGFFLPRMTTTQRDAIHKDMGKDNGLAIYNVDIDCVEYWSERSSKWMSVCGTLPPADLEIEAGSCESITFNGFTMVNGVPQAQQGTAFKPEEQFMTIRLKVNQIGTYTISALSDNGYFFSAEGQFQSIGTYQIVLKGMGTPVRGYDSAAAINGDKLQFSINGQNSTNCTDLKMLVIPADLDFTITSATHHAKGTYYVGVEASTVKGNTIEVDIRVVNGGLATITASNPTLGMKFQGTKQVISGTDKIILEPILGENTPLVNSQDLYLLTFEVNTSDPNGTIGGATVDVKVEKTKIEGNFNDSTFGTEPYYQETPLNANHTITLPVQVIGSGKTNLFLKGAGGIEFKAENVKLDMPANAGDVQEVLFRAVAGGLLPRASSLDLTLSGDAARFEIENGHTLVLPIDLKPVQYTLDCATIKANRGAIPANKPIEENYFISAQVNVTVVGEYEINTTTAVDGILFSTTRAGVKQVFRNTGVQEVKLYAVDGTIVPTSKGEFTVGLSANDMSHTQCNQVKVKVGFNDISILIVRSSDDYMSSESSSSEELYFTGRNANGQYRFGEEGAFVETGAVNVRVLAHYSGGLNAAFIAERARVIEEVKAGKYNFILTAGKGAYLINEDFANALYEYVENDKGVLWLATIYEGWVNRQYVDMLIRNNGLSSYPGTSRDKSGYELIKRFNNGNDIDGAGAISDSSFNLHVVDESEFLTKPRNGYDYANKPNGGKGDIHWYYTGPTSNQGSFRVTGSNYRALVADRGAQFGDSRGIVFVNKMHENFIWAPIVYTWYYGTMRVGSQIDRLGEPYKVDQESFGITNTGAFSSNIFSALIERLANK